MIWELNPKLTGAMLRGTLSPAVCTGANTAMPGGLRSDSVEAGGISQNRQTKAGDIGDRAMMTYRAIYWATGRITRTEKTMC